MSELSEFEYFKGTWDGTNLNINATPNIVNFTGKGVLWCDTWTLRNGTDPVMAIGTSNDPGDNYAKKIYFCDGEITVMLPPGLREVRPERNLILQDVRKDPDPLGDSGEREGLRHPGPGGRGRAQDQLWRVCQPWRDSAPRKR